MSSVLEWINQAGKCCLIVFGVGLACANSANAEPYGGRHAREGHHAPGGQYQQQSPRDAQRAYWQSTERRDTPAPQRLSPDERRQLRRDIQDAGREIYPYRR